MPLIKKLRGAEFVNADLFKLLKIKNSSVFLALHSQTCLFSELLKGQEQLQQKRPVKVPSNAIQHRTELEFQSRLILNFCLRKCYHFHGRDL